MDVLMVRGGAREKLIILTLMELHTCVYKQESTKKMKPKTFHWW